MQAKFDQQDEDEAKHRAIEIEDKEVAMSIEATVPTWLREVRASDLSSLRPLSVILRVTNGCAKRNGFVFSEPLYQFALFALHCTALSGSNRGSQSCVS